MLVLGPARTDARVMREAAALAGAGSEVTVVDIEHYRIPDRIVFPTLAMAVPALAVAAVLEDGSGSLWGALGGAVLYFVMLFVPHLVYPRGMGFGDVMLGLLLGWIDVYLVVLGLVAGCLLGVLGGLATLAVRRRREFPFGPALALSTVAVVLLSPQLLDRMAV